MSALAEALVAAQRRALHAVEKAYVNGNIDKDDAAAILDSIGGCDDLVDRGYLFKALDTIKLFGATLPTEQRPANGAPEAKASAAQLARIRRDLEARGLPMLAEADAERLTKQRALEMIDALASPDYDPSASPSAWDVPF